MATSLKESKKRSRSVKFKQIPIIWCRNRENRSIGSWDNLSSFKKEETRNAWQSLAYSQLGAVVLPPSDYLWNTPNYWSRQCLTAPPPSKRCWTKGGKIVNVRHSTSYVLNSTLRSLNRMLEKCYSMYRNNCHKINVLKSKLRYCTKITDTVPQIQFKL